MYPPPHLPAPPLMASDYVVLLILGDKTTSVTRLIDTLRHGELEVLVGDGSAETVGVAEFMVDAAAVVVASTGPKPQVADLPYRWPSVDRTTPVRLTDDAWFPDELAELEAIDLRGLADDDPRLPTLVGHLRALVADTHSAPSESLALSGGWAPTLTEDAAVTTPLWAVGDLQRLVDEVKAVATLLADNRDSTKQVRATLDEIGASYQVVLDALVDFAKCARLNRKAMSRLANLRSGRLVTHIHN